MNTKIRLLVFLILLSCKNDSRNYSELFQAAIEKTDNENYIDAIPLLNKVIVLKPDFDSAYIERAYNLLQIDQPEKALSDVNKAIEINYQNVSAYYTRAMIYNYFGENEKALDDYTHIIRLNDSVHIKYALEERSNLFYKFGEFNKSITDLNELINLDSNKYIALVSRGIAKSRNNVIEQYSDSIKIAWNNKKVYDEFFKYFRIFYNSSGMPVTMLDTRGALQDFSEALKIKPEYDYAYYNRAIVYKDLDMLNEALNDINEAIKLKEISNYYVTRALTYRALRENKKSLSDLNKAIELDPNNSNAYRNRGYLKQQDLDDPNGGKKDLNKADELDK